MSRYVGGTLGDFTGTAIGTPVQVDDLEGVKVLVGGTFVGTVFLQVSHDGVSFVNFQGLTAPGLIPTASNVGGELPPMFSLRAECTAYTSGTIEVRFGGLRQVATNVLQAIST